MFEPRTINHLRVMDFLRENFHLDSCLIWPISSDALLLEDADGNQIAYEYADGLVQECEIPEPGSEKDVWLFQQYLKFKYPEHCQRNFDTRTKLWLTAPVKITYAQALGLEDELFRHYLTYPMLTTEEVLLQLSSGDISMDTCRSILLWYLDGHIQNQLILGSSMDEDGPFIDFVFRYYVPDSDEHPIWPFKN